MTYCRLRRTSGFQGVLRKGEAYGNFKYSLACLRMSTMTYYLVLRGIDERAINGGTGNKRN